MSREQNLHFLQQTIRREKNWPRTPDPDVRRQKPPGWLLPYLLEIDSALWGRWDYWAETKMAGRLLSDPIPKIPLREPEPICRKMLEASLDCIPAHGKWQTWGSTEYMDYFLDWLLYGFGHLKELPREPSPEAFSRLYQVFCLDAMCAWPSDYFGDLLAETRFGRGFGFYPTPMCVCEIMGRMLYFSDNADYRDKSIFEPCVGTGRMLLIASNFSMSLHGMDISSTCVKAAVVNGFIYAPWMVRPFGWMVQEPCPSSPVPETIPGIRWVKVPRKNYHQGQLVLT